MAFSVKLNDRFAREYVDTNLEKNLYEESELALETLVSKNGKGKDFLGWVELPNHIQKTEIERIEQESARLKSQSEAVVIVGIGGSYLGAKAVIDSCKSHFESHKKGSPEILYAGQHLDSKYLSQLLSYLEHKDFSVNVISKSGTTTEPAIAFRNLWELLKKKYGEKAKDRVIATTDSTKGALRKMSEQLGFVTFSIPDDIGGRYSVLTPVGLLPVSLAGIDISQFLKGFQEGCEALLKEKDPRNNVACKYAVLRNHFYRNGRLLEVLANFSSNLDTFTEWWKQLYGESEGKDGKGIFPAGVHLTTDLHSMGQYLQDGERKIFETMLHPDRTNSNLKVPFDPQDLDGINFVAGRDISEINREAMIGTLAAHSEGGVPCLEISFSEIGPKGIGHLMYFFQFACGISGYMLGVNPFDQPGVEAYKQNMFALLGKPGLEELRNRLKDKGL
ncbi:glucose-6-phosphate isomerase [Leptospira perolatii]|uniref:Glucose-6-phosphate isomerase n=1 Tax=Leptospira perolatii TaxID=2023191 RepID=A0A2M9ZT03_9LEPT|nr:glucose-6-phosphate isomerase [Leptospira perolatii]PJZ71510.1 glucose-6-phosphate isomerase [Leptospira perolatii]PJZ75043.1 glucose-6-phosphate isomerase [Leptospira perolatii]